MPDVNVEIKFASRDYWRRFLKRAVALLEARDARRLGRRFPFSMDGRVIFTVDGCTKQANISILDVSATGVMGLTSEKLPVKGDVRIEVSPEGTIFALRALTIHSKQSLGGFKSGFELSFME